MPISYGFKDMQHAVNQLVAEGYLVDAVSRLYNYPAGLLEKTGLNQRDIDAAQTQTNKNAIDMLVTQHFYEFESALHGVRLTVDAPDLREKRWYRQRTLTRSPEETCDRLRTLGYHIDYVNHELIPPRNIRSWGDMKSREYDLVTYAIDKLNLFVDRDLDDNYWDDYNEDGDSD